MRLAVIVVLAVPIEPRRVNPGFHSLSSTRGRIAGMETTSRVFLIRVPDSRPTTWPGAVGKLIDSADLLAFVRKNDRVAIKLHVGESGLRTALPATAAAEVARRLRSKGAQPFFTDTSVLYSGRRNNGPGHAEVAAEHGFTLERSGACFIPADGMAGNLAIDVDVPGHHFSKVGIAEAIAQSNGVVSLSHATGHMLSGFGATLKNLGMGCAARKGKLLQHSDTKPFVKQSECASCGACVVHCPTGAIKLDEHARARIDEAICTGCGECIAHCREGGIRFRWDTGSAAMQEKMVEFALGTLRVLDGRACHILGIVNLTQHCDCWAEGSEKVAPDVGFAASTDPVALDQAMCDLVAQAAHRPLDALAWPQLDGTVQLAYAERLGLGSRRYTLTEF